MFNKIIVYSWNCKIQKKGLLLHSAFFNFIYDILQNIIFSLGWANLCFNSVLCVFKVEVFPSNKKIAVTVYMIQWTTPKKTPVIFGLIWFQNVFTDLWCFMWNWIYFQQYFILCLQGYIIECLLLNCIMDHVRKLCIDVSFYAITIVKPLNASIYIQLKKLTNRISF